jgi:hypothetical protein
MNTKRTLKKTIQNPKEKFNIDIKILKRNKIEILEMKSSISQINPKASPVDYFTFRTE